MLKHVLSALIFIEAFGFKAAKKLALKAYAPEASFPCGKLSPFPYSHACEYLFAYFLSSDRLLGSLQTAADDNEGWYGETVLGSAEKVTEVRAVILPKNGAFRIYTKFLVLAHDSRPANGTK